MITESRDWRTAPLVVGAIVFALAGCSPSHPTAATGPTTGASVAAPPTLTTRMVPADAGTPGGAHPHLASDPAQLADDLVADERALRNPGTPDPALTAAAPDVPPEHALQGFDGVRAYAADPQRSAALLDEVLGFRQDAPGEWTVGGDLRSSFYVYDPAPGEPGIQGAGSVHHVAFATYPEDQERWQRHMRDAGAHATPVIDRFYFRSLYFREPGGVLFEIATDGPGFAVDEDVEALGERLALPPFLEPQREAIEANLKPIRVEDVTK